MVAFSYTVDDSDLHCELNVISKKLYKLGISEWVFLESRSFRISMQGVIFLDELMPRPVSHAHLIHRLHNQFERTIGGSSVLVNGPLCISGFILLEHSLKNVQAIPSKTSHLWITYISCISELLPKGALLNLTMDRTISNPKNVQLDGLRLVGSSLNLSRFPTI